ncbi:Calcium-dependent protein kinase 7 [Spatholobus suberectus]|nr:Calcium-dependent protein kinase 7 [Spatholobus suberectus]
MGNCCTTPLMDETKNKKAKKGKKNNSFAIDYRFNNNNSKANRSKVTILKSSTGHEIEAHYKMGRNKFRITYLCTDKEIREELACKSILRSAHEVELVDGVVDAEEITREKGGEDTGGEERREKIYRCRKSPPTKMNGGRRGCWEGVKGI